MSDQSEIPGEDASAVDEVGRAPGPVLPAAQVQPPRKKSNPVSVVGLVLAVLVWPLGLIVSLIGVIRSTRLGGVGRTLGIVGLIVSLVVGAGSITVLVVHSHKTFDPGCASAETGLSVFADSVNADEAKLQTDESNQDETSFDTDLVQFVADLQSVKGNLDTAAGKAVNAKVKSAVTAMDTNLGTVITGYQGLEKGDTSKETQTTTAGNKLQANGTAITALCT